MKKSFPKGLMFGLAAVVACGLALPAAAGERLDAIKDRGTLRVAGVVYEPLMILVPNGGRC